MTFMTSHDGVVYERDLGPKTAEIAGSITSFDPGPEWKVSTGDDADNEPPTGSGSKTSAR
jgi:hypothetical protein